VALLRLSADSSQPPVKLATPRDMLWIWPGSTLQVAGWGTDSEEGADLAESLQYTELPLVNEFECRCVYGKFLPDDTLCAGFRTGGHDSCYGDSGGPLLAKLGGKQLQVGSAGAVCAEEDWYGLDARVASFGSWITKTMADAEGEPEELGACVGACEATPCEQGENSWSCSRRKNSCSCACANGDSEACLGDGYSEQDDAPAEHDP
jgi:secreted trypsin-like serine protease